MKGMRRRKGRDEVRGFFFFQLERRVLSEIITNISFKGSDAISQEWERI